MNIKYHDTSDREEWLAMIECCIPELHSYPKRIKRVGLKVRFPLEFVGSDNDGVICRQLDPQGFEDQYRKNWIEGKKMHELNEAVAFKISKRDFLIVTN